jgi:hypothetical protein
VAVDAQLDPEVSRYERTRRLQKAASNIEHWQNRNAEAAFFHDRRKRRDLHRIGIDLRKVRRCPLHL